MPTEKTRESLKAELDFLEPHLCKLVDAGFTVHIAFCSNAGRIIESMPFVGPFVGPFAGPFMGHCDHKPRHVIWRAAYGEEFRLTRLMEEIEYDAHSHPLKRRWASWFTVVDSAP